MAKRIIWRKKASDNLIEIVSYLQENWSPKDARNFIDLVDQKVDLLTKFPKAGKASQKQPTLRKLVLTPQNTLIYRIKGEKVIVLKIYDTRQNESNI